MLRDAGFEVIYTGLRQRPAAIAATAVAEDVAVVGLSILSGAHMSLVRKTMEALAERDAADIMVVVGGTVPAGDVAALKAIGVADVFPTGTSVADVVSRMTALVDPNRADAAPPAVDA